MAGEFAVPDAPLSHADEEAHRRLIAARANAIGYEQGEFTPTFDFATSGDLSNVYTTQEGYYWRIGPLVHFMLRVDVTPTFTTASGALEIHGLPFQCVSGDVVLFSAQLSSANVTYPTGRTQVLGWTTDGRDYAQILAQGSATSSVSFDATHFTSGSSAGVLRMNGFYPMK